MKLLILFLLSGSLVTGCGSSSGTADIKKTIEAFTDFYSDKDPKVLKRLFAEDIEPIVYNMDNEVWKGAESIQKKIQKNIDDVEDSNIDIRDQVIKVEGNTAWFSERGDWHYDYKGQRVNLEGIRMTGVLHKEDGKWKIVQWHSSYPVRAQQQQQQ